ncbi:hypothetical protein G6F46_012323 [Rhizopus delemar]|uniref:Uncharacterized protein n=2 Tax=Rhizopus TaxID=4842 RepID=A0A9P6YRD5_9FUNG|nr:hypothetical protein G6F55_010051 [Rhizopus delemar]KAG1533823.1 hypothetical protein G6F51_012421 [Rhizopus arrhizus]KAG1488236.1 hypothetical protein G6F54_012177 [Rhizopus delemar]KAG1496018.1 hypothetical protein G6F53_012259 [Rhizopus delemar]KAG1511754.1 hypothetical protein G6F52_010575 [Rhizopus delemar]
MFNSAKAENIAAHYGKKFVNSLTCMSDNYWFLVTSLNVFIHNNPKVDDFADQSKIAYQIELLATGGFWGDLKSCTMKVNPFLGSSISGPPETLTDSVANPFSREIFVIKPDSNKTASVRSNRTINQYVKEHSQTSNGRNNAPKNAKLKAIVDLLKFTKQRYAFTKNIRLNNQEMLTKRKELINIYNSVLYNAIKSINMAKVRKAEEMFSPKKLNIFDEEDNEEDNIISND